MLLFKFSSLKWQEEGAVPKHSPFFLSFQFYDLLIQHGVFFLHHHVVMVVTEEPVAEPAPLPNLIEEVGQRVFLVKPSAEDVLNTGGQQWLMI